MDCTQQKYEKSVSSTRLFQIKVFSQTFLTFLTGPVILENSVLVKFDTNYSLSDPALNGSLPTKLARDV